MNIDWSEAEWHKSTYSGGSGGECVEVAFAGGRVGVRDSKDPAGPNLVFAGADWDEFLGSKIWQR
ncbi:DUF397 domain-containing protein [Nocardia sp. ET3-3]|uniref:DUF397 domain-containing protein n=1 Tax=Nocardia terrae TaxID=2675851 RepID=A0A7K1V0S6_9NOCA|nr:DUF397 domain-containing protein [Nocardia terrae]